MEYGTNKPLVLYYHGISLFRARKCKNYRLTSKFIKSGRNHLARHKEKGKKTRQIEKKRWEDIKEWRGLEFANSQTAVERRKFVVNRTTRTPPGHRKETQTAVVWSCLPFIRSGQNHLIRHSERGKKTRQTEEEVGRQHQAWSSASSRGQWRTGENGENWFQNYLWCPNDPRG